MAWFFMGEPNAFMIPTMKKMCHSATDKYWRDGQGIAIDAITNAIKAIPLDNRPIIVVPKIGCGCSRMREIAPGLYEWMWFELNKINFKNIEWI